MESEPWVTGQESPGDTNSGEEAGTPTFKSEGNKSLDRWFAFAARPIAGE